MRMAHRQLLVARWLGDEGLQARCRMHFVYSLVQCGRYRMALALIRELQAVAKQLGDRILANMCGAAALNVGQVRQLRRKLRPARDPTRDDAYRQRLVALRRVGSNGC